MGTSPRDHEHGHLPDDDIPVVTVCGLLRHQSGRDGEAFTTISERAMTTTVNDIEHIESQSVMVSRSSKYSFSRR